MQQTQWNISQIKQCEKETGQAMLRDEHQLVSYHQDFGKLIKSNPAVVFAPDSIEKIQSLLYFANQLKLPVTIRGMGLSQGGQSLSAGGGLVLHLKALTKIISHEEQGIWAEATSSWADLLNLSLKKHQIPAVLPYNCNLSIAGVLSAGGIGASSFKYGSLSSQVQALEVVTMSGELKVIDRQSELFHACLSGQGRFAVITKACIKLRPCLKQVRTFFLVYLDKEQWLADLAKARCSANYIEAFCTPAVQGAKLVGERRKPFAQWLYVLHLSVEYENSAPGLEDIIPNLNPWKLLTMQDETIASYLHRHDSRFEVMKLTGQWELQHPWYECFIPTALLHEKLEEILDYLPLHYAPVVQVVPIVNQQRTGFFMLPEAEDLCCLMILNPGVNPALVENCLDAMVGLDNLFLKEGGKRYLSGYLGTDLTEGYWQQHFGSYYEDWLSLKKKYDPNQILGSFLYPQKA